MLTRALLTGLVVLSVTSPARGWDDQGHMMVAAVAFDQLTPATKARVAMLLALNKYPTNGENDVGEGDKAKAAFVMAATSPDAIKRQPHVFDNDGEDPRKAPAAGQNIGYNDRYMHKYWHYVDRPFSPDHTKLIQPPKVNAQERVALFRKTLASDVPDALKAFDLVWLLHLVGDVHQPLHAASRFTHEAPRGDDGGNGVRLRASGAEKLHGFWDDAAGESKSVAAAIDAARALPPPDPALAAKRGESDWVRESFMLAKTAVYVAPVGPGPGPFALDDAYKANAKHIAEQRIALAGARLANLLNTELK